MLGKHFIAAALVVSLGLVSPAGAQLPPGVFAGQPDYRLAPAGPYTIDPSHTAVIAKVSHIGYSMSVFRFEKVSGTLRWDPAKPDASALDVTVETASIATPVPGFAKQLSGPDFLKSERFPSATFVSTGFRQTDASHGRVDGRFTLMGKTAPVSLEVALVGAGAGFMGHPRIGVEATGHLMTSDFGLPAVLGKSIDLVIDTEFSHD